MRGVTFYGLTLSLAYNLAMMSHDLNHHKSEERLVAFRHARWLAAGTGAVAVAAVAAVAITVTLEPSANVGGLSSGALGINVAPWDGVYTGSSAAVMQPLLSAAGIGLLRYGGSTADYYDWKTNTSITNCLPYNSTASFASPCASTDSLDFAQFSKQAKAIGANTLVAVNYGSGTPTEAAAWVTAAKNNGAEKVARWEVGNETYSCAEVNNELAGAPAYYKGYHPAMGSAAGQYQSCPQTTQGLAEGTRTLATSYADNALLFMKAMKKADSSAVIGVPWAFSTSMQTYSVADANEWNNTVLGTDGAYVGFVDAHWYPFSFSGSTGGYNPSDAQVLHSLQTIPSLYASIRAGLATHDPTAGVVIGETAVSSSPTTAVCTPVGALFAAGDTLSWLAAGAKSVDWWDLNNYGNTGTSCSNPDYGLFTSAAQPAAGTPYYGYLLASLLAKPGAHLKVLSTSDRTDVLAYQSVLPNGKHAVAFINLNTSAARTVRFSDTAGLTGTLSSWAYSAGTQNSAQSTVVSGTMPAASIASGIRLPAESVTVLETQ